MLSQEERKQMILKLFVALKESNIFPGYTPVQIKEAAIRAEQRIYEESGSKEEYLRGMDERFQRIERVVSNRSRADGRGKSTQEQMGSYEHVRPQFQGFRNGSEEPEDSTKQGYHYGNPRLERGERRLSEQLFTENKHVFGMEDGFSPSKIMGMNRKHNLEEMGDIPRFNSRSAEGNTRGRSNSCNIQNSLHESVGHTMNRESFADNSRNPMPFRRFQSEVNSYGAVNGKDFRNATDQRHFYMQREERPKEAAYRYGGGQAFGPGFGCFDYSRGNGNRVPRGENPLKSPADMNFIEMQRDKASGAGAFNGQGFIPLQHPRQFSLDPVPSYSNSGNMNVFPFSNKTVYGARGPFISPNDGRPGHIYPPRMPNVQNFPMPSSSDAIGSFSPNPHDPVTNMFSMGPQSKAGAGGAWMGDPPSFDRHYPNPGQGAMKSSPLFFNQQLQHQPYFHHPRNSGQQNSMVDRKKPLSAPENPSRWMFNHSGEDFRVPYDELPHRYESTKKSMGSFDSSKKDERNFSTNSNEYKGCINTSSWHSGGFRSFFPESNPPDSIDSQKRIDSSLWFRDKFRYGRAPEAEDPMNTIEGNHDVYKKEKSPDHHRSDFVAQQQTGLRETSQNDCGVSNPETFLNFPSEVNAFLKDHEMEKIYLCNQELLDLKTRLKEGISVINKSLRIYNAFKDAFPSSELLQKYETIKNLLEKQEEYIKYGAYFLKARSIDSFIDQIKSLTVDMSYDLKLNTMDASDINYGECLMNAVKAFAERKKKEDTFSLNVIGKNTYE
ncbi:hypothetical protein M970_071710 [Encephalitozoon cuniculi EcunIII-L]|nr:hypothetical protein M970_071710 [Encephalitozoon cuniculi EcunIII-L]